MKDRTRRWLGWAGALALTVFAIQWVDSGEAPPAREAAIAEPALPAESTRATAAPAAAPAAAPVPAGASTSDVRLDLLRREPYPALKSDPFKAEGEAGLDPGSDSDSFEGGVGGRRSSGPPPPPPLPFTYMGKMLEDGKTVVFLTRGDRNYVVRQGATIDGQYRVDQIGARTMVLTYLPAKAKQTLAIGSAP